MTHIRCQLDDWEGNYPNKKKAVAAYHAHCRTPGHKAALDRRIDIFKASGY